MLADPGSNAAVHYHDLHPPAQSLRDEVLAGLAREPKGLAPKWFYDSEGARLFDAICALPEYYPTRTETALLRERAGEIAATIGPGSLLIEPGSGSCDKVRWLLESLRPRLYMPTDICHDYVQAAAEGLAQAYPWLEIHAAVADFTDLERLPVPPLEHHRVVFFPGSTIGNFEPEPAQALLARMARLVGPGGGVLIGVDLQKPVAQLEAAYNDSQGVTAAFNLNLLRRLNRELGADFDLDGFRHRACYNADAGRVEMHLESLYPQQVQVAGECFSFGRGETIHTENSYKYTVPGFQALARAAGLIPARLWQDAQGLFSLHYLTAR